MGERDLDASCLADIRRTFRNYKTLGEPSRDEIMRWWESGWQTALGSIESLTPEDLGRTVTIRNEPFLVVEALNRAAAHVAYHVGQIVFLAKHFAGPAWTSLSIPKVRSAEAGIGH